MWDGRQGRVAVPANPWRGVNPVSLRALFLTIVERWTREHPEADPTAEFSRALGAGSDTVDLAERLEQLVAAGWSEEFLVLGLLRYGADLWRAKGQGLREEAARWEVLAEELEDDEPEEAQRWRQRAEQQRDSGGIELWLELAAAWEKFAGTLQQQSLRLLAARGARSTEAEET